MAQIDLRDVRVTVTFAAEEARFLAGAVVAAVELGSPTKQQQELAHRVAGKFLLAGEASKQELIDKHGLDAVLEMADRAMAAYPNVEYVSA